MLWDKREDENSKIFIHNAFKQKYKKINKVCMFLKGILNFFKIPQLIFHSISV